MKKNEIKQFEYLDPDIVSARTLWDFRKPWGISSPRKLLPHDPS